MSFSPNKKEGVLYIPGLGAGRSMNIQKRYLNVLNKLSRRRQYFLFEPNWETEPQQNAKQLYERLEEFYESNARPSIIYANSAGGALATRLAIEQTGISECHLICAKILGAAKIGPEYRNRAPALYESVSESETIANKIPEAEARKFYCYTPKNQENDGVLETIDMKIAGSHEVALPALQHAAAITYAALRHLPRI